MQIELWPLDRVTPYEHNPRKNDHAIEAVARSITEFGFRQPIVVDTDGVIVVGHTRWKAAKALGLAEVPVHVAEGLTPEQARAYRIADNQSATIATWDAELLPLELKQLKDLGFDLDALGFGDALDQWLAPPSTPGLVDADDVPAPPDEAETQTGDLWVLGEHRLLCGDCTDPDAVRRLMQGHVERGEEVGTAIDAALRSGQHGIERSALRAIALASYHHAQQNPRAVMRGRPLDEAALGAARA